jgi:hypothetical protein
MRRALTHLFLTPNIQLRQRRSVGEEATSLRPHPWSTQQQYWDTQARKGISSMPRIRESSPVQVVFVSAFF